MTIQTQEVFKGSGETISLITDNNMNIHDIGDCEGIQMWLSNGTVLSFAIDSHQHCCEDSGYFISQDSGDFERFIGAKILNINVSYDSDDYTELRVTENANTICVSDCVYVTVYTDKGDFQFTAYNVHNGYYGHNVKITLTKELFSLII